MASFGDILKRERELREISLREISDATKINIRYLEALEQNRFEILPGGLFNKGFIRAYAVYVGLDGEDMVNAYLDELAVHDDEPEADAVPLTPGVHRPTTSPRRRIHPGEESGEPSPTPHDESGAPRFVELADDDSAPAHEAPAPEYEAASPEAKSTRILVWVFGLIAGVSLLFLALGIFMPRGSASRPGERTGDVSADQAGGEQGADEIGTPLPDPAGSAESGTDVPDSRQIATFGATPEASPPIESSPSPAPADDAAAVAPVERMPMDLRIKTRGRTWVQVFCDSREAVNWVMRAGDSEEFTCYDSIRVSATDAAAVKLAVNGAACLPLGEKGQRIYGYTLRAADFRLACPEGKRGSSGRR